MPRFPTIGALILATCACNPALPARAEPDITFAVHSRSDGDVQLRLEAEFGEKHDNNWWQSVALSELKGLSTDALTRDGRVHFDWARPAGRFSCDGLAHDRQADGRCTFTPDDGFRRALETRGIGRPDEQQSFALAMSGVAPEWLDALDREGWSRPTLDETIALGIFKITPDFVQAIGRAGYKGGKVQTLVAFKIHGVTPEAISALGELGYRQLSPETLLAFRIHRVTPDYVRDMAALGYRNLPAQTLIQLRIFNITPDYVRSLRANGKLDVSADQLVKLRMAGIGPDDLAGRR
jgi:hypothetical protein